MKRQSLVDTPLILAKNAPQPYSTSTEKSDRVSKGQRSSNVPVDYTLRRHVKKPGGAVPGFVIYTHQRTLYMTVTEADVRAIKEV